MRQLDYNRAEEYITLRDELLNLQGFTRQILHWTIFLVIVGLGWYLNKLADERIELFAFAAFLYALIFLSVGAYLVYTNQIYRIGSYLAVFWESHDNDRRMQWHRFNRRGPVGGFLPDTAVLIYAGATIIVVGFVFFLTIYQGSSDNLIANIIVMVMGVGLATEFIRLRDNLRNQRNRYEREWKDIRASQERRNIIHASYETIPIPAPPGPVNRPQPLQTYILLLASLSIVAIGLSAYAIVKPMIYPAKSAIPVAVEKRIEHTEQTLQQMGKKVDGLQQQFTVLSEQISKQITAKPPPQPKKRPER